MVVQLERHYFPMKICVADEKNVSATGAPQVFMSTRLQPVMLSVQTRKTDATVLRIHEIH